MITNVNERNVLLQEIDLLKDQNIRLCLLREDLIHSEIPGNKWRKLKYNLQEARNKGFSQVLTFGGAYSNHIAATAAAGKEFGFKTVGIIRGEENLPLNHTLQLAQDNGMEIQYVSRSLYSKRNDECFLKELKHKWKDFYLIPEGGSNAFAVKGCSEIIKNININYDMICCACGTGGTISGIIASAPVEKQILGFPVLKGGGFLKNDINKQLKEYSNFFKIQIKNQNWNLITDYHFGGYAKVNQELFDFVKSFKNEQGITLDLIYTGKMMFGLYNMMKNTNCLDNKNIVVVHTGGVQGNQGFEKKWGCL